MEKLLILLLACTLVITGCRKDNLETDSDNDVEEFDTHDDPSDYIWENSETIPIMLGGSTISIEGEGASADASVLTISSSGTYSISGNLDDGQIIVDTKDDGIVRLILDGVDINCSTNPPIIVRSSHKTMIVMADGTNNFVSDKGNYINGDEYNAAIYSADDLTIFGNGTLNIDANYNDGITSKDGLIIASGNIIVEAVDDAIRGKDYLIVKDTDLVINSGGDGLKSDNDEEGSLGYITILDGQFEIIAGSDGIQAESKVVISDGDFSITTGGGSSQSAGGDGSSKGIKSEMDINIVNGLISIDAADDGINANAGVIIDNGTLNISSGDDGIKASESITITDGSISIEKSSEGMEAPSITVSGGNIAVVASDDGINPTYGVDGEHNDGSKLVIEGGYIYIKSSDGDAIDSNGDISISGGTVVVHGSSSQGGFDVNGSALISGGFAIISGTNNHMTEGFSPYSDQYSVLLKTNTSLSPGTIIHLDDENGNLLFTYAPENTYKSILFSSSLLAEGVSYSIYTEGSYIGGDEKDGLYTGGTYVPGEIKTTFTITSIFSEIEF